MRIRFQFAHQRFTATLEDTPSARDLWSMLPLDLIVGDYGGNEKIADLPHPLTEEGSAPFSGEAPGDLGYWGPWGNLALYHGSYRYAPGLIRLDLLDDGPGPLLIRGEHPLRVERAAWRSSLLSCAPPPPGRGTCCHHPKASRYVRHPLVPEPR